MAASLLPLSLSVHGADSDELEQRIVQLYQKSLSAVVRVKVAIEGADADQPTVLIGSGFFINREGQVLTTFHATSPIVRIWVVKDGIENLAELVGVDPRTNIGLLQVKKFPEKFDVIPIEEMPEETSDPARDRLPIGSLVLAVTSPKTLDPSPKFGLIAGYESFLGETVFPFTYLRTNIPVFDGEPGSPVLAMRGQLAGIAVGNIPEVGSSYLVPRRALARILKDLGSGDHHVHYGTLPVDFGEYPDSSNITRQVMVERVHPGSSAEGTGLRAGDIVRRLGSRPVRRIHDVRDALFYARPGEFIQMDVERDGRMIPFALGVEEVEPEPPAPEAGSTPEPEEESVVPAATA